MAEKQFLCIDLKSFFASVECVERGLDPMKVNLIVADPERTDKTICLAITPAMKALGIKNRCRVFEIPKHVEYITAPPRMQKYIDYAAEIYSVYLNYVSKDDIHVYSIDEVFIDVTHYLPLYKTDAKTLAQRMMADVLEKVGVRATCGIGTNMYLAKIALDITAKHADDFIGVLDEESYKATLWDHRPITDFWRIGAGTARRLERAGIYTMGDIAATDEDLLYSWFGIDAELLIDHAWGREPTEISHIKSYKSKTNCLASGQVLMRDYTFAEARLIVKEMVDLMCLELVDTGMVAESITLQVGYSNSLALPPDKGTVKMPQPTNSDEIAIPLVVKLYEQITQRNKPVRRINLTCNRIVPEGGFQLSFFDDPVDSARNHELQKTVIGIKKKFGKNAIVKGMNLEKAATTMARNKQIGGHKSGE
ncbi:MAG: DNA repair protein [Clostridia bacterium]|nr:DNA repair protein [Clostridia bacterium]